MKNPNDILLKKIKICLVINLETFYFKNSSDILVKTF